MKTFLPDSPHPIIISKKSVFRALHLAKENELSSFRLITTKKCFFSFIVAGFYSKNLAFARKITACRLSGGRGGATAVVPPAPLACRPMLN